MIYRKHSLVFNRATTITNEVPNVEDNCVYVFNPEQVDENASGASEFVPTPGSRLFPTYLYPETGLFEDNSILGS